MAASLSERALRGVSWLADSLKRFARTPRNWLVLPLLAILPGLFWERCGFGGCPDVTTLRMYQPRGAPILIDRTGTAFGTLAPVQRQLVELSSLPDYLSDSFIAIEDRRFPEHHGVDFRRIVGATLANIRAGGLVQGSSTITMQLARNVFGDRIPASERSLRRKLIETRVALEIERHFTKYEILELYVNHIYFGGGAWGIEAAAWHYFGIPASELSLDQAALLAALPKAPAHYDPRDHSERAKERRDLVLSLMAEQGHIAQDDATQAKTREIRTIPARGPEIGPRAAWFAQVVREQLEARMGRALYEKPYRIHTSIDLKAQTAAEEELERQIRRIEDGRYGRFRGPRRAAYDAADGGPEYLQGAVVIMDPATGDVLALVGGRDIRESSFNRATHGRRQTGSAFKPFVYAAALNEGWSPYNVLDDEPVQFADSRNRTWTPSNFDGQFLGPITVRDAIVLSRNVPTVRLAHAVGEEDVATVARAAGLTGEVIRSPVIALGVTEASPLELTAAYTAFAGAGEAVTPRFVLRIEDPAGNPVWSQTSERRRVLGEDVAYLMTDLMRDAVDRGTGYAVRSAGFRGPAAGKTGTTNDATDNWFVGYTPALVGGVWIGFDKPRPIAPNATGGTVAAYAWGRMMSRIDHGNARWRMPDGIVALRIDPASGLVLADGCSPVFGSAITELSLESRAPTERVCPGLRANPLRWAEGIGGWLFDNTLGRLRGRQQQQDTSSRRRRRGGGPAEARLELRGTFERELRERQQEAFEDALDSLEDAINDISLEPRQRRELDQLMDILRRSAASGRFPSSDEIGRAIEAIISAGGKGLGQEERGGRSLAYGGEPQLATHAFPAPPGRTICPQVRRTCDLVVPCNGLPASRSLCTRPTLPARIDDPIHALAQLKRDTQ